MGDHLSYLLMLASYVNCDVRLFAWEDIIRKLSRSLWRRCGGILSRNVLNLANMVETEQVLNSSQVSPRVLILEVEDVVPLHNHFNGMGSLQ